MTSSLFDPNRTATKQALITGNSTVPVKVVIIYNHGYGSGPALDPDGTLFIFTVPYVKNVITVNHYFVTSSFDLKFLYKICNKFELKFFLFRSISGFC
jgi:hypothetical protein